MELCSAIAGQREINIPIISINPVWPSPASGSLRMEKKYYFDEKTGKQKVRACGQLIMEMENKHDYFLKDGGVAKGLYTDNKGDTYYFAGNNGIMVYGLQNINGKKLPDKKLVQHGQQGESCALYEYLWFCIKGRDVR